MLGEFDLSGKSEKLPYLLHSWLAGKPFELCISCGKHLLNPHTEYFIEKAIEGNQVVFEYAMCSDCAGEMSIKISEESKSSLQHYMLKHLNTFIKRNEVILKNESRFEDWISTCIFKGLSVKDIEEYQICAYCKGDEVMLGYMPYMISGTALKEIQDILSVKTKEELDGFIDRNFGLPPEWKEILKRKDIPVF